jgi:ribulose-phosphate 3-epimerase
MKLIAPSILAADFSRLGQEIQAVQAAGADWIHIDVMDGHFVPNITMGPIVVKAARKSTALPLDVHLMIQSPDHFIADFVQAGATHISVHVETCPHLNRTVRLIKDAGAKAGVVLNPATPLCELDWILDELDLVLVMSVNPGFGGQTFIPGSLEKIRQLRRMMDQRGSAALIQVDGGVSDETIEALDKAGADVFVAGSAIFGSRDYRQTIAGLRSKISPQR